MENQIRISLYDLVLCVANTFDLTSPVLINHHKRTGYIAFTIAMEMGLPLNEQVNILYAGLLHDCGSFDTTKKKELVKFKFSEEIKERNYHGYLGYLLLKDYEPFSEVADIVKYHHVYWSERDDMQERVLLGSNILHLADRIEILIDKDKSILDQVDDIIDIIEREKGVMFSPLAVEAFKNLSVKESFWFYLNTNFVESFIESKDISTKLELTTKDILRLGNLLHKIIDYRNKFTATHSVGVSISSAQLAQVMGFNNKECEMMKIAGLIHDMGKLAIPPDIIEKPGKLTKQEYNIMKSHTFYSYNILNKINELKTINEWASFHHERLDGSGYPFRLTDKELSKGSKIMAVADVFTALSEDRPYRAGMSTGEVGRILQTMANDFKLDKEVVSILKNNYAQIDSLRIEAQLKAEKEYTKFEQEILFNYY
ncbi:HD domain-containing protein [Desulfonispora thiosulfatigenes DSM 11270]|uniref:HD domain-containing protein n=1 Tax=Desulfonispora thiosulfatigenes DSM 11270 TaxID=656914 RepID=A0A1W1VFS1_DESTI|nr:HD domain-containing phosphohydrolase [Desulfonispora thiosulfatigenes]SMB92070.1 HD domain-containing protein [Desulfonispora thiosulfatigenes DSM 11270]